jgi:hypothetical protein
MLRCIAGLQASGCGGRVKKKKKSVIPELFLIRKRTMVCMDGE